MKKKFIIVWCKPRSEDKGGFKVKIKREFERETPFGMKKGSETYYSTSLVEFKEGDEIELNMSQFTIEEYEVSIPDDTTGELVKRGMKWLHVKEF